jgi:hypothetical protein
LIKKREKIQSERFREKNQEKMKRKKEKRGGGWGTSFKIDKGEMRVDTI